MKTTVSSVQMMKMIKVSAEKKKTCYKDLCSMRERQMIRLMSFIASCFHLLVDMRNLTRSIKPEHSLIKVFSVAGSSWKQGRKG